MPSQADRAIQAAAAQIFEDVEPTASRLWFHTRSGWLSVTRQHPGRLTLDFPVVPMAALPLDGAVNSALGAQVRELYQSMDLVCVVGSAVEVRDLTVNLQALADWPQRGVIVTAAADESLPELEPDIDFVSRFFGARAGGFEDPVTGSAHCQLAPFWSSRLGRNPLQARQLSSRGGSILCEVAEDRVKLTGGYRRYLDGVAHLADIGRS